nr:MAG TPA: Head Tail Connector Protein [Caudoviricetes sp.]
MLKYIDQEEYIKLLGADSIPDDFNNLVIKASSYINRRTFGRIDINNIPEQVKYATCLIIELENKANIQKEKIGNLKSQNIEGWSESYSTPEEINAKLKIDKEDVLKEQLWDVIGKDGNYLLHRGE